MLGHSNRVLGRHATLHGAGADPGEHIGQWHGDFRRASEGLPQAEPLSVSGVNIPGGSCLIFPHTEIIGVTISA